MSDDHPEFPQESPAIQYIVGQVAKVEDASNCAVGYYKSLAKIISRLDKTDVELNRLSQSTTALVKITDSTVIATVIGHKSDQINQTLHDGLAATTETLNKTVSTHMGEIMRNHQWAVNSNAESNRDLNKKMGETITRLDTHIRSVNDRLAPPWWKLWLYMILTLLVGIGIGRLF